MLSVFLVIEYFCVVSGKDSSQMSIPFLRMEACIVWPSALTVKASRAPVSSLKYMVEAEEKFMSPSLAVEKYSCPVSAEE